jgi:hypothetical protein
MTGISEYSILPGIRLSDRVQPEERYCTIESVAPHNGGALGRLHRFSEALEQIGYSERLLWRTYGSTIQGMSAIIRSRILNEFSNLLPEVVDAQHVELVGDIPICVADLRWPPSTSLVSLLSDSRRCLALMLQDREDDLHEVANLFNPFTHEVTSCGIEVALARHPAAVVARVIDGDTEFVVQLIMSRFVHERFARVWHSLCG